jgi:hypothetical protein
MWPGLVMKPLNKLTDFAVAPQETEGAQFDFTPGDLAFSLSQHACQWDCSTFKQNANAFEFA